MAECIEAVPWLILTNGGHVVVAEGFGLGDLDNQLKQQSGKAAASGK
jgi:hypothetical protein